jgi:NADH-quinone oxidoreductase subunit L
VGVGAYVAAIFHMITHAFFKALLFLGSGSVIHGMHGDQDMRHMGGLRRFMPVTAATFIVGWLAIAGVPPFSGFFSKDEILLFAWGSGGAQGRALWAIGLVTALLTAFYMSRQVFMVFFGEYRGAEHAEHAEHDEPHESPGLMTAPLVVLAVAAAVAEVINLPFTPELMYLEHWLEPVVGANEAQLAVTTETKWALAVVATVAAVVGISLAALVYLRRRARVVEPAVLAHAWYYDEAITRFVGGPGTKGFEAVAWFDRNVVDGAVNGVATLVRNSGRGLRTVQSGFVRSYALGMSAGVVVVLGYFLTRLFV